VSLSRGLGVGAILLAAAAIACNGDLYFDEVPRGDAGATAPPDGSDAAPAAHPCAGDSDCGLTGLRCDVAGTRTCVDCLGELDCALRPFRHCDLSLHRCVACAAPSHCATGQTCVAHLCVPICYNDNDLLCPPAASACEDNGICAACEGDEPCPTGSRCLLAAGACVSCLGDWDCASTHCDTATYRCVACTTNTHCPPDKGICDLASGTCQAG
jgi:hypothetical protein